MGTCYLEFLLDRSLLSKGGGIKFFCRDFTFFFFFFQFFFLFFIWIALVLMVFFALFYDFFRVFSPIWGHFSTSFNEGHNDWLSLRYEVGLLY
jgi:hypothetical protein